ncbi:hypothetical protein RO3G_02924 [Rhizopus delemar RA 99-880]|uniref:Uncharacterized protein n=1 Tax=Rhizopus delemar (strain RA 99-880 / ATCC MYA-4621 / FGSC 9543 / NRRL 43880) TaxID=246409 RepID=I1BPU0_RHIO9|nr:hypothetical protein RO3G_02924 [Rhizopus delemar RA 99-880]|eukprot:EIE78220.1 hypothetical protein RO3G_02924 [Rhizopus delemar RA 99-880]
MRNLGYRYVCFVRILDFKRRVVTLVSPKHHGHNVQPTDGLSKEASANDTFDTPQVFFSTTGHEKSWRNKRRLVTFVMSMRMESGTEPFRKGFSL